MAGNRLMLRLAGIFGPPSEGVSLGAGIFRILTDLPSFMRNIMMGRLVSLRRRSRMGLGSGDSHPSFNFYVQYYVEATSGKLVPTCGKPHFINLSEKYCKGFIWRILRSSLGGRR